MHASHVPNLFWSWSNNKAERTKHIYRLSWALYFPHWEHIPAPLGYPSHDVFHQMGMVISGSAVSYFFSFIKKESVQRS